MHRMLEMNETWHECWPLCGTKLGMFGGGKKNMLRELPYQQTRTFPIEHGIFVAMHEMTQYFPSMWACPWQPPTQNLNEFRHRTHVVSRLACVLVFFHRKKPRKCMKSRKPTKLGMHAVYGHSSV